MASLIPNQNTKGCVLRRIEFDPVEGGRRQRLRLGRVTGRDGEDFKRRLEEVIRDLRLARAHTGSLCEWLNGLTPAMQKRFQKLGLLQASRRAAQSLGDFLDSYKDKARVKGGTLTVYGHTMRNLLDHFGRSRMLQTIGPIDAIEFKEYLEQVDRAYGKRPLARATVNRRIKMAKQFFASAKGKELISKNPFDGIKGGHQRNADRLVCVDAVWVDTLVEHCDEQDWKLLLLLGRYGGLRIPSEL